MATSHDLLGQHGKASLPQSVNWSKTKVFTTIPVTEDRTAGGTSEHATGPGSGFVGTWALECVSRQTRVLRSRAMNAAIWTAIGLLAATSLGSLFYLGARIDGQAARTDTLAGRMDARFDALLSLMGGRFDRVDARLDHIDARFDHVDDRFDALQARLDAHLDRHAS